MQSPENESGEGECAVHDPVPFMRFVLIFAVASSIALIGALANIILGLRLLFPRLFNSKTESEKFPLLYLSALSVLDAFICLSYVLIMGMDALGLYMRWEWLYLAWTYYGIPVFTISRVVQLASSWLIVSATFERLILLRTENWPPRELQRTWMGRVAAPQTRRSVLWLILGTAVALRAPTLWELEIAYFPTCNATRGEFGAVAIRQREATMSGAYFYYDFYAINLVQVVLPFLIVLTLNVTIISRDGLGAIRRIMHEADITVPLASVALSNPAAVARKISEPVRIMRKESWDERAETHRRHGSYTALSKADTDSAPSTARMANGTDAEGEDGEMAPLVLGVAATAVYLHRMANMREREIGRKQKSQVDVRSVNSATYTFLWIAASYTACNALSLFVSVLERLPGKPLLLVYNEEWNTLVPNQFYVLTTDIVSFLFMFCSFLRPIIFVKFNTHVRCDWQQNCRKPI